jgi:hypothetical protein
MDGDMKGANRFRDRNGTDSTMDSDEKWYPVLLFGTRTYAAVPGQCYDNLK